VSATPDWLEHGYPYTPYGGLPPTPDEILQRWNLDPLLIGVLIVALVAYAAGGERPGHGAIPRWRRLCFYGGWMLGALALISPLCALSVSLFSARVAQHMLLTTIVAPLIALGRPGVALARGHDRRLGRTRGRTGAAIRQPILAALAFAAALWAWQAPAAYAATFDSSALYWVMRLTTFAAALWLWSALLGGADDRPGGFVVASLLTTLQMSLLAAIITFAGRLIYLPHVVTAGAWGLTPLEDQQLGGVVMWFPAGAIFVAALVIAFTRATRRAEARVADASPITRPA
jgi:putative membrane protein